MRLDLQVEHGPFWPSYDHIDCVSAAQKVNAAREEEVGRKTKPVDQRGEAREVRCTAAHNAGDGRGVKIGFGGHLAPGHPALFAGALQRFNQSLMVKRSRHVAILYVTASVWRS